MQRIQKVLLGLTMATSLLSAGCTDLIYGQLTRYNLYPGGQTEECAQFIECSDVYADQTGAEREDFSETYGPEGICWESSMDVIDACTDACAAAVRSFQEDFEANDEVVPDACMSTR